MEYSLHLILLEYRKKPNSTFKKIKTSSRSQAWYPVPLPSVLPVCFSAPRQTSHWEVVSVQDSPDTCRDAVFRLWWEGFGAKIQHFRESTGPCHGWRPRTWSGMLPAQLHNWRWLYFWRLPLKHHKNGFALTCMWLMDAINNHSLGMG